MNNLKLIAVHTEWAQIQLEIYQINIKTEFEDYLNHTQLINKIKLGKLIQQQKDKQIKLMEIQTEVDNTPTKEIINKLVAAEVKKQLTLLNNKNNNNISKPPIKKTINNNKTNNNNNSKNQKRGGNVPQRKIETKKDQTVETKKTPMRTSKASVPSKKNTPNIQQKKKGQRGGKGVQ